MINRLADYLLLQSAWKDVLSYYRAYLKFKKHPNHVILKNYITIIRCHLKSAAAHLRAVRKLLWNQSLSFEVAWLRRRYIRKAQSDLRLCHYAIYGWDKGQ